MSVDALRRLTLMLLLENSLVDHVQLYEEFALPEGVALPAPGGERGLRGWAAGVSGFTTHQTAIAFALIGDAGAVIQEGDFVWPDSHRQTEQLLADLVESVEVTLRPGCPPAALPASLFAARPSGAASQPDDARRTAPGELAQTLGSLRATPVCRAR